MSDDSCYTGGAMSDYSCFASVPSAPAREQRLSVRRASNLSRVFSREAHVNVRVSHASAALHNVASRVRSGQKVLKISRVGSGRVGSDPVGSRQEVFKYHGTGRVGSP